MKLRWLLESYLVEQSDGRKKGVGWGTTLLTIRCNFHVISKYYMIPFFFFVEVPHRHIDNYIEANKNK